MSLRGDISKLKGFSASLSALPKTLAIAIAAEGATKITELARETFDAGEDPYGNTWQPDKDGKRATLVKSGGIERGVVYGAIGTKLRIVLGVPWAKFQIGKRPVFPRAGAKLPAAYVAALTAIAKDAIAKSLKTGGAP